MCDKRTVWLQSMILALALLCVSVGTSLGAEYFLRAEQTTIRMPDGKSVPMWGYALDSAFGKKDGTVTVPGPALVVPPGDTTLVVHLDNNLPVRTSLVIPGQVATYTPTRSKDGRVRSFTREAWPGNSSPRKYRWTNLKPGTYLYLSGTNPAVQVQMGLYGALTVNYAVNQAYSDPSSSYDAEATLLFSEVDPAFHRAVANGNYGPRKAVTSALNYTPKYFLINGDAHPKLSPIQAGNGAGQRVLLRFLNAGLYTHIPLLQGEYMTLLSEDGNLYPYPKQQYTLELAAGRTMDAIVTFNDLGFFPLYDRMLNLTNAGASPGGMLAYLKNTDDIVRIRKVSYDSATQQLTVVATSNAAPTVRLRAAGFGFLEYKQFRRYAMTFKGVPTKPGQVKVVSTGGGSDDKPVP